MNDFSPLAAAPIEDGDGADGRMRFTVDQFFQMADAGLFVGHGKVELLNGEIFVSPQYRPHSRVQKRLFLALHDSAEASGRTDLEVLFEASVVDANSAQAPQPDIVIAAASDAGGAIPIGEVMLIVEVAATSNHRDEKLKKALYAAAGVPEYWVASLADASVHRYAALAGGDYRDRDIFAFGDAIASATIPGIGVGQGWFAV